MSADDTCDVAIVGGGPVGLYLALRLVHEGVDARVYERSLEPEPCMQAHSRAIGIHPKGLACLATVGVADALVAEGIEVRRAHVFSSRSHLGSLTFESLVRPYQFVLTVPQSRTEALLRDRLKALAPSALVRGQACRDVVPHSNWVDLHVQGAHDTRCVRAKFVVGCDGKSSTVRRALRISYAGGAYPSHFLMGDMPDATEFGSDAAIFLHPSGLAESFPLPGGMRRFVVGTGRTKMAADSAELARLVLLRTGQQSDPEQASMVSAFTAEHYMAERFASGRVILAGDAAHVVSPIGGQGMNLGFLDANRLAPLLRACVQRGATVRAVAWKYAFPRSQAAHLAMRRAELFMRAGQGRTRSGVRDNLLRRALSPGMNAPSARFFTMWGL